MTLASLKVIGHMVADRRKTRKRIEREREYGWGKRRERKRVESERILL